MAKHSRVNDELYRLETWTEAERRELKEKLFGLGLDEQAQARELAAIKPLMQGVDLKDLEKIIARGDRVEGISTGYWTLDRMTAGLVPGELMIVSALTGIGKTNLCVNMAARQIALGHKVLFISLENSETSILRRLRLIMGKEYFPLLVGEDNFFIQKSLRLPYRSVKYAVEAGKKLGVDVVYIDHLHFFQSETDNSVEELGQIVYEFKTVAQEYDVPIVLVSQMRKVAAGERPTIMDLHGSSKIAQGADFVLIGDRDPTNFTQHLRVCVYKQRDRVLWRQYSEVILQQYGFNLEEPQYNEELDMQNDITGQPRAKGSSALSFLH